MAFTDVISEIKLNPLTHSRSPHCFTPAKSSLYQALPSCSYGTWKWAIIMRTAAPSPHSGIPVPTLRTPQNLQTCPCRHASDHAATVTWEPSRPAALKMMTQHPWTHAALHLWLTPQFAPTAAALVSQQPCHLLKINLWVHFQSQALICIFCNFTSMLFLCQIKTTFPWSKRQKDAEITIWLLSGHPSEKGPKTQHAIFLLAESKQNCETWSNLIVISQRSAHSFRSKFRTRQAVGHTVGWYGASQWSFSQELLQSSRAGVLLTVCFSWSVAAALVHRHWVDNTEGYPHGGALHRYLNRPWPHVAFKCQVFFFSGFFVWHCLCCILTSVLRKCAEQE